MNQILIILLILLITFLFYKDKHLAPKYTLGDLLIELDAKDAEAEAHGYILYQDKYYRAEEQPDGSVFIYTKNDLKSTIEERYQLKEEPSNPRFETIYGYKNSDKINWASYPNQTCFDISESLWKEAPCE